MSTNLRKAQKHMQRATKLLNYGKLGFGAGDENDGVGWTCYEHKKPGQEPKRKKPRSCTSGNFRCQIQNVCYMYSVYNLILRKLYKDPALNNLESVKRAKEKMSRGDCLRVGRNFTLEPKTLHLYSLLIGESSMRKSPDFSYKPGTEYDMTQFDEISALDLTWKGGSDVFLLQAMILATKEHNEIAVVRLYKNIQ